MKRPDTARRHAGALSICRGWRAGSATAICVLAAALGGCAGAPPVRSAPPVETYLPELAAFKAVLTGREAVPPANSPARGELVAVLDRNTGLFRWKLNYSGLSGPVRSAHFHSPAMSGKIAAPVLAVGGRGIASPYEGRALLTTAQRADLLAGQWYVNLRTERYPQGELRGQLIEQH